MNRISTLVCVLLCCGDVAPDVGAVTAAYTVDTSLCQAGTIAGPLCETAHQTEDLPDHAGT
jgi:hypothetical protein